MELENLTTGEETPQVNVEEQTEVVGENTEEQVASAEAVPNDTVEELPTTDPKYESAYNDVWDKDINEVDLETIGDTTVEEYVEPVDTSTNNTNNSIGAFMTEKPVLKYKGKDVPIESADELLALAQKGFSYETEMANIKPQKKMLKIVEGIPLEVLQAVADLNNGKSEAINYLKSAYGIKDSNSNDSFWDDSESTQTEDTSYTPEVSADDPVADYFNEYTRANQVGAAKVNEIYAGLDESFKAEIYKPDVFPAFVASVESGEFDSVYPLAVKEKVLNPAMTWIQAYQLGLSKAGNTTKQAEPPASATPPKQAETSRHVSDSAIADRVWNDPEYFAQLEAKLFN